jgi:putative methanogenesis marker domain 9
MNISGERLISSTCIQPFLMLEVGYLNLDSPIAIICPSHNSLDSNSPHQNTPHQFNGAAGLLMLDDINLDEVPLSAIETSLNAIKNASSLAFSLNCSKDEPLIEAARFAAKNLYLMELDATKGWDAKRLYELVEKIKRCGTTLSARVAPQMLTADLVVALKNLGLDILHLNLHGMNGTAPKVVRKISDVHGAPIMAMGDVGDFEDAQSLLSMGADLVSLRGADPEFASWLSQAMKECDHLSGWYNAPKHICSGGDLRGLAFCCPPVKHCPVLGALRRTGMSPEEFVQRKLKLAKGTPLEHGEGTCFGSLVWCCKASKPCFLRDAALDRIGLSGRDYMQLKRKLADQLLNQ